MKFILSSIFTLFIFISSAQLLDVPASLSITERTMLLDNIERNGYSLVINGEEKEVLKSFGAYTESAWDVKVKSKSDKVVGEDLISAKFSDKHFGINAYFVESDQGNELRFFVRFGTDIFVNSKDYLQESNNCLSHLRAFAKKYYGDYVNEQIDEKKSILAKSQKTVLGIKKDISKEEKSKLKEEKAIEKLEKSTIKYQEKIRKAQESITENDAEIVSANTEIEKIEKTKTELVDSQTETQKAVDENTSAIKTLEKMLTYIKSY